MVIELLKCAKHCFVFDDGDTLVNKASQVPALMGLAFPSDRFPGSEKKGVQITGPTVGVR